MSGSKFSASEHLTVDLATERALSASQAAGSQAAVSQASVVVETAGQPALMRRVCPSCGTDNSAGAAWGDAPTPWILRQCQGCQLVYLENPPHPQALVQQFAWEATFEAERQRRRREEPLLVAINSWRVAIAARLVLWRRGGKLLAWIRRYVASGRLLDVGCGPGVLISRVPATIAPYGVEVSEALAVVANGAASERGGYVIQGAADTALSLFSTDFFDGIVMCAYLEHETRPTQVLRSARRILRPGGTLIIKVPNFGCWNRRLRGRRWCGFRYPDHVNYFTPASLVRLLEASGFEIARFRWCDRLPTNDNMWILARKPAV